MCHTPFPSVPFDPFPLVTVRLLLHPTGETLTVSGQCKSTGPPLCRCERCIYEGVRSRGCPTCARDRGAFIVPRKEEAREGRDSQSVRDSLSLTRFYERASNRAVGECFLRRDRHRRHRRREEKCALHMNENLHKARQSGSVTSPARLSMAGYRLGDSLIQKFA